MVPVGREGERERESVSIDVTSLAGLFDKCNNYYHTEKSSQR